MDTIVCKEVIISTLKRRGLGTKLSPIRVITEVYEKDGTLIADKDPSPELFTITDMIHFGQQIASEHIQVGKINKSLVEKWVAEIK